MKSTHEEIEGILPEYLRGSLPPEEAGDVELHLRGCQACRESLDLLALLKDEVPDPGDLFWRTLSQKVSRSLEQKRPPLFSLSTLLRPLPLAAAVVLLLSVIFVYALKHGVTEYDPLFTDPFTRAAFYEDGMSESEVLTAVGEMMAEDIPDDVNDLSGYTYLRDFAALEPGDLNGFYSLLAEEQKQGG